MTAKSKNALPWSVLFGRLMSGASPQPPHMMYTKPSVKPKKSTNKPINPLFIRLEVLRSGVQDGHGFRFQQHYVAQWSGLRRFPRVTWSPFRILIDLFASKLAGRSVQFLCYHGRDVSTSRRCFLSGSGAQDAQTYCRQGVPGAQRHVCSR